jgi:hypothetical protein
LSQSVELAPWKIAFEWLDLLPDKPKHAAMPDLMFAAASIAQASQHSWLQAISAV